jgi:probable DNA metabolism protein
MKYSLGELFNLLKADNSPGGIGGLFDSSEEAEKDHCAENTAVAQQDLNLIAGLHSSRGINPKALCGPARILFELSIDAFDAFIHAWMSELPIETEIIQFGRRIIAAAGEALSGCEKERLTAYKAASDLGAADTQTVLKAAYKARHEIHRLQGLLRFNPNSEGVYIARCCPDHFVLPAFGEYFTERFGETAWAVLDEKRSLCLYRTPPHPPVFTQTSAEKADVPVTNSSLAAGGGEWEGLWKHYHKTINNEDRKNPALQRQFMPERYRKYLPECEL